MAGNLRIMSLSSNKRSISVNSIIHGKFCEVKGKVVYTRNRVRFLCAFSGISAVAKLLQQFLVHKIV